MRKLIPAIVLSIWLSSFGSMDAASAPLAGRGNLDLRETSLADVGLVDLRGEWEFYWETFVDPDERERYMPNWISTPATWGSQSHALAIQDHGYGTYFLRILLSEHDVGQSLGLYLPSVASAFELYLNGEKLASNGRIGDSAEGMEPATLKQTLYFTPDEQEIDLFIYVSNFNQRKGGIWDTLKIGTAEQVSTAREHCLLFHAFIATGLLLMGLYHLGLFLFQTDISTFYFGLTCLLLFLRSLFVGEFLAYEALPGIPWELGVKIEYMSVFLGISCLVLYFYHLYDNNMRRTTSHALSLLLVCVSLPIMVLPARIYTEWMVFYQSILLLIVVYIAWGLARAAMRGLKGARLNFIAGLLFLAAVVNDTLHYNFIVQSIDMVTLGLFLFIFTQMLVLASKFTSAFDETVALKGALMKINENLESVVHERTKELHDTNQKLVEVEQTRKDMLASITHEFGNPLTTIIGYLKAMKDGVSDESRERHLQIVFKNALKLERMTEDLRELATLEQARLRFDVRPLPITVLVAVLRQAYSWDTLERKIELDFRLPESGPYIVRADAGRIEQAFCNIVNNALAHTKPGDKLVVTGRLYSFAGIFAIAVRDTGTGIMKEHRKRLFERFYRVQSDNRQREGSGLGLAIAKAILDAHQGRIGVRSEYGQGSVFYILLPIMQEAREVRENEASLHIDC